MKDQVKNRILYVGPQTDLAQNYLIRALLVSYDVHRLSGKKAVLGAAQQNNYALYIVDEEQSDAQGLELCRELRALDARTPIIVLCADMLPGKLRSVAQTGAQWCLSKPVDSYCLLSAATWLINSTMPVQPRIERHVEAGFF